MGAGKDSESLTAADVAGGVGGLALLVGIIALAVAGYGWLSSGANPDAEVVLGQDLKLKGAPKDTLSIVITGTRSIAGRWASEHGLNLELDGRIVPVAEPRERDWDDSISFTNDTDFGLRIDGEIVVPEVERGRLQGAIRGDITYPEPITEGEFTDVHDQVEIPVVVDVVSRTEADQWRSAREGLASKMGRVALKTAVLLLPIGLLGLALQRLLLRRSVRAETRARLFGGRAKVTLRRLKQAGVSEDHARIVVRRLRRSADPGPRSAADVGAEFGLSATRVESITRAAIRRLKAWEDANGE